MRRFLLTLGTMALCAMILTSAARRESPAESVTLNVFAAAGLSDALNEIAELYKSAAPHVTLLINYNSSGVLQNQIENGAEADVFLSAGPRQLNDLAAGGYIDNATRKDLLINTVVLIVPKGSSRGISSFEDCLTNKVSLISFGNASTPLGQYAEQIFTFLNGWEIVSAKASRAATVKEVLSQVESGSVDCGIVWATEAATSNGVTVVSGVPTGSLPPSIFPGAVLKNSPNAQAALAFFNYLSSPQAVAVFERLGFTVVR